MLKALNEDWALRALGPREDQVNHFAQLVDDKNRFFDERNEKASDEGRVAEDPQTALNNSIRDMSRFGRQGIDSIIALLDAPQLALLELLALRAEFVRGGMIHSLVNGVLGRKLEIANSQKDKLKSLAEELSIRIEEKAETWERTANETVQAALTAEQRKRLRDLLGPELKGSRATIDAMIKELTGKTHSPPALTPQYLMPR